jgi:hypothetical protein
MFHSHHIETYCEDASFYFFHKMFDYRVNNPSFGDSPVQTVDMLDFFGIVRFITL